MFRNYLFVAKSKLDDEDGAMTVFGIFVILVFLVVSAVGLDVAKLMSARNQLQIAADSAAHAALYHREFNTEAESQDKAVEIAEAIMKPSLFGEVLKPTDVEFGTWDSDARTFTVDGTSKTAVRVNTKRLADRDNSVASLLFKFVGISEFDVGAPAVFETYKPWCFREGFVAEGVVDIQSNNGFANGFCIHSNSHVEVNNNNTFESGTVVSMPNSGDIVLPQSGFEHNAGLEAALREGTYIPRILNQMDDMIDDLATGNTARGWIPSYITNLVPVQIAATNSVDETDFQAGRLHYMTCTGSGKLTISPGVTLTDFVFVGYGCKIKIAGNAVLENVVIASTDTSSTSINSSSGLQVGRNDGCADDGGAQLITKGGMNFAAGLEMYGGRLLAAGDIDFSANANGIEGASMVAGGRIDGTSNMQMSFCGTGWDDPFQVDYFRLAS